jgi:hypothetical protein
MNRQKWLVIVAVFALVGVSGATLGELKARQRLGAPGVKSTPLPGQTARQIELPAAVLDYTSEAVPPFPEELGGLPKDTSFGRRLYGSPDGGRIQMSVVMMGTDRTSIHQPQFCLTGQGWALDPAETVRVGMTRPVSYELPVTRITATKQFVMAGGGLVTRRGVYVYWFVADRAVTASPAERMKWLAVDLLRTGVLQRWAYVSCFTDCAPGGEKAAYQRLEQFISAAVPEFQLATTRDRE